MDSLFNDPFNLGFISGVLFMIVLMPVFFWFGVWKKKVRAVFTPQSIIHKTKKSPFQVFSDAVAEITVGIMIAIILVLLGLYFL